MIEHVILVDERDNEIGLKEKLKAHQEGTLHRAFSIFIFNSKNEVLMQKRAKTKYHSAGLWTNTCCSHPRKGESLEIAVQRRLKEEMGFNTKLTKIFDFIYKAPVGSGLIEHEFDHVFIGRFEQGITPNPDEVESYRWMSLDELLIDLESNPQYYTEWLKIAFKEHLNKLKEYL